MNVPGTRGRRPRLDGDLRQRRQRRTAPDVRADGPIRRRERATRRHRCPSAEACDRGGAVPGDLGGDAGVPAGVSPLPCLCLAGTRPAGAHHGRGDRPHGSGGGVRQARTAARHHRRRPVPAARPDGAGAARHRPGARGVGVTFRHPDADAGGTGGSARGRRSRDLVEPGRGGAADARRVPRRGGCPRTHHAGLGRRRGPGAEGADQHDGQLANMCRPRCALVLRRVQEPVGR